MPSDPFATLGEFLTASEAEALAAQFAGGQHTIKALAVVNAARRGGSNSFLSPLGWVMRMALVLPKCCEPSLGPSRSTAI